MASGTKAESTQHVEARVEDVEHGADLDAGAVAQRGRLHRSGERDPIASEEPEAAHRRHEQCGRGGDECPRDAPAEPADDGDGRGRRRDATGDAEPVAQRERSLRREQVGDEHVQVERRHEQGREQPDARVVVGCDVLLELPHHDQRERHRHDQQDAGVGEPVAEHRRAPARAPAGVVGRGVLRADAADAGEHGQRPSGSPRRGRARRRPGTAPSGSTRCSRCRGRRRWS